ncbi:hypothetical protein, partial [Lentzea sp. NPDC004782]|uniref:hypothetical protein n=1 Tax=Lentzea sp. NPDC004782 TaxID=3154458 RepID=UPI0033BC5AE8
MDQGEYLLVIAYTTARANDLYNLFHIGVGTGGAVSGTERDDLLVSQPPTVSGSRHLPVSLRTHNRILAGTAVKQIKSLTGRHSSTVSDKLVDDPVKAN